MANPFSPENFTQLSRVEFNETHRKPNEPLYLYVGRLKKILDTIPGSSTADQIFMISSKLPKRYNNRLLQLKIDTYEDFVIKVKAIEDEFQLEDAAKKKKREEEAQKSSDPKSEPSTQNQNPKGKKAKKQQPNANLNSLEQSLNKLNLSDAISISINVNKSNEIITGGAQNPESDSSNNRKSGPNFNKQKNFNKKPNQNFQQQPNAPPNQFNKNRNAPNFHQKRGNYQGPPSGNLAQAKALSKSSVTLNLNANAPNNNKQKPNNFKGNKPGNLNFQNQGPKLMPMPIAQSSIYPNLSSPTPPLPPVQPNSLEVTLDHRLKISATLDPTTALSSLSPRLAAQLGFILPGSGQEPYDHIDGRIHLRIDERNLYWIRVRIDDKSFHELTLGQDFLGCYRAV